MTIVSKGCNCYNDSADCPVHDPAVTIVRNLNESLTDYILRLLGRPVTEDSLLEAWLKRNSYASKTEADTDLEQRRLADLERSAGCYDHDPND